MLVGLSPYPRIRSALAALTVLLTVIAVSPALASAQGVSSGVISGTISDETTDLPVIENLSLELWQNDSLVRSTTTDSHGYYQFPHLAPGDFVVKLDLGESDGSIVGQTDRPVSVAVGETATLDWQTSGAQTRVFVTGRSFDDVDGDGVWSDGDAPMAGIYISLTNEAGPNYGQTGHTNEDGIYELSVLPAEGFLLRANTPTDFTDFVTVATAPFGIAADGQYTELDLTGDAVVSGFDFASTSLPTTRSAFITLADQTTGFPIAEEVTLRLLSEGLTLDESTVRNGLRASFDRQPVGTYTLEITSADGFEYTTEIELVEGDSAIARFDFALDGPDPMARISGVAFDDLNDDGVKDEGEENVPVQSGRTVFSARVTDGGDRSNVTLAGSDSPEFEAFLVPGRVYELEKYEYGMSGWDYGKLNPTPPSGEAGATKYTEVVLESGEDLAGFNLGLQARVVEVDLTKGSVSGVVRDLESGAPTYVPGPYYWGWLSVELHQAGEVKYSVTAGTPRSMEFAIAAVEPGTYDFVVTASGTPVTLSPSTQTVTVVADEDTAQDVTTSGTQKLGMAVGSVYNDLNLNGVRDAGEPGIPGVELATYNGWVSTVTDADGRYQLARPVSIYLTHPEGWLAGELNPNVQLGSLAPGSYHQVDVPTNRVYTGYDFALFKDDTPPTITLEPADGAVFAHGSDLVLAFECADEGGSELVSCEATLDGEPVATGTVIDTNEPAIHAVEVVAVDGSGNMTAVGSLFTVEAFVDEDAPTITLSPANGSVLKHRSDVSVVFECADLDSEVASCVGSVDGVVVPSGHPIDTGTPGEIVIVVAATDGAGLVATTTSRVTIEGPGPIAEAEDVPDIVSATDYNDGSHAEVLRLYQAIFGRYPDLGGAKYWIGINNGGHNTLDIAGFMSDSKEWQNNYAGTSDADFVAKVYANVLGRAYDQEGYDYWLGLVQSGQLTRHEMVFYVTANAEFIRNYPFIE